MHHDRHIARDISYASSARSRAGRALIRILENATGRLGLIRRADGYEEDVAAGGNFWDVMAGRYGLRAEVIGGALERIPAEGPVVLVANHPYGILDGLILGQILSRRRAEYRILANQVFRRAEDLEKVILPIDFDDGRVALERNIATRKESLRFLSDGGAIGVFPGGTVSTSLRPFGHPMDPGWRNFTARMIAKSEAVVVPIYFEGHNSRLFQVASRLHTNFRLGLLINEFRARVDTPVRLVIGAPLCRSQLDPYRGDPKSMMDFLREATYRLSPKPLSDLGYGFEFENRHKN